MSTIVMSRIQQYHLNEIEVVRQLRHRLGNTSHVAAALTDQMLEQVRMFVESSSDADLLYGRWPFLFSFVMSNSEEAIAELDADLELVSQNTPSSRRSSVTKFLQNRDHRTGVWYGGLFETWFKANLLRRAQDVRLDVVISNGRDHDVSITVGKRQFHFEGTALTEDDESREVWARFMEAKKVDPNKVLVRPGAFCPANAKGPSPYYLTLRLYAKVYDKLTSKLDPEKGQFSDQDTNVLLICFAGANVGPEYPGVRWGLEELFADNPRMARTVVPEGFTDISLDAWADFRANELIHQNQLSVDWYCEHSGSVLRAPNRVGAAMTFDNTRLAYGRLNYNAFPQCRISHAEMAELECLLSTPAKYFL